MASPGTRTNVALEFTFFKLANLKMIVAIRLGSK
jgi:hypothetical protein